MESIVEFAQTLRLWADVIGVLLIPVAFAILLALFFYRWWHFNDYLKRKR